METRVEQKITVQSDGDRSRNIKALFEQFQTFEHLENNNLHNNVLHFFLLHNFLFIKSVHIYAYAF